MFVLQIGQSARVGYDRPWPDVLSLMHPSRTRGVGFGLATASATSLTGSSSKPASRSWPTWEAGSLRPRRLPRRGARPGAAAFEATPADALRPAAW